MEVAHERVAQTDVVVARPTLVAGIHTHIRHEQIEEAVAVIVEEHRTGGVADVSHCCLSGDVAKRSMSEVFKQPIPVAHRRDEEVGIAVVVDVGERASDRDGVRHFEPRLFGDIHEPTFALVLPELVGAELRGEIKIGQTIAIDVRGTEAGSVVVVHQLVRPQPREVG